MPTISSKLQAGTGIDLHGHQAIITHTDAADTTVQYGNLARRTFDTDALNSFLELKKFPVGTKFVRPIVGRYELATITAFEGDASYRVDIISGSDAPRTEIFTFTQLILWHMSNPSLSPAHTLAAVDAIIYHSPAAATEKPADEPDEEVHPFEAELQDEVERLRKEVLELKGLIAAQKSKHDIIVAAYETDIEQLEKKAAIVNAAPTYKEYCIKTNITESDMNKLARDGWEIRHSQFMTDVDFCGQLWVVFVRDIPAAPAPKVVEKVTEATYHIGAIPLVSRTPVQSPANTVIHQPMSRALTNNRPEPGATKRIPTLAAFRERQQADEEEIAAIFERAADEQEKLRRNFALRPSRPFGQFNYPQGS